MGLDQEYSSVYLLHINLSWYVSGNPSLRQSPRIDVSLMSDIIVIYQKPLYVFLTRGFFSMGQLSKKKNVKALPFYANA